MSLDDNIVNFNVHHVYTGFPKGSGSNFHDVNPKETYELRQLGHGSLQTIHLASTHMVTFPYMALVPTLQLCAC